MSDYLGDDFSWPKVIGIGLTFMFLLFIIGVFL